MRDEVTQGLGRQPPGPTRSMAGFGCDNEREVLEVSEESHCKPLCVSNRLTVANSVTDTEQSKGTSNKSSHNRSGERSLSAVQNRNTRAQGGRHP